MNLQINPAARVSPPAYAPNVAIDLTASHTVPAETVVFALGSDPARGLSRSERRLEQYGPNQLASAPEIPWWKRFLEQFQNFLVIILLFAIVISVIEWLLQDPRESALPYEAIVITAIVVLNALLGFFQEARAERSVRALMALAAPESTVVRDGERQRIAAHEIVPGDIVLVEAGDKIPADARIIEDANLRTDEAPLTGESMPVAKSPKPVPADMGLGEDQSGTYIIPYPCEWSEGAWRKVGSAKHIEATVIGWRAVPRFRR
jgi:P-type Ca2+ transporter type 2C